MDGATKAAIVLLAADRGKSVDLLKRLNADEVRSISRGAEGLSAIDSDVLLSVISNFEELFNEGLKFLGTADEVRNLIAEAIGKEDAGAAGAGPPQVPPPDDLWPTVRGLPIEDLRTYIVAQHPQVAAFILTKLDPELNAELLEGTDVSYCADLMTRMLTISEPAPAIVAAIEETVAEDLCKKDASTAGQMHADLAAVINRLERSRASEVVNRLTLVRPADAKVVERMLFRFEDLGKLPAKSLATVVEALSVEQFVQALAGMPQSFQEIVLGVMSPRTRRMAESELQNSASIAQKAIVSARQSVVDAVLRLASSGSIELDAPAGERA